MPPRVFSNTSWSTTTAARLGATQVLCAGNDPDINRLTDNYAELCELAHPYGLNLSIEPMP